MAKIILLTNGGEAIVDDDMYEEINSHSWQRGTNGAAYRSIVVEGCHTTVFMHRIINNTPENFQTDHINRNRLDNRKCNLRNATPSQNGANRVKYKGKHSSTFKGVHWCNRARIWMSRIRVKYRMIYLGSFRKERDAAKSYNKAAKLHFGEFAQLNEV